nr:HNH endonuclease [Deinococcus humi]
MYGLFPDQLLVPGEIAHHFNGDRTNSDPAKLPVLPSQRFRAKIENRLCCAKRGLLGLFSEPVWDVTATRDRRGTLFEGVILG